MIEEFFLVQNPALGAHLITEWVRNYHVHNHQVQSMPLHLSYVILPIVLNRAIVSRFSNRTLAANGFYRALYEDRSIFIGLNERALSMINLTNQSIGLAFSLGWLSYDGQSCGLVFQESIPPRILAKFRIDEEYKSLLKTAKRFGKWSSEIDLSQFYSILGVLNY